MLRIEQGKSFLRQLRKCKKRGKNEEKLYGIVRKLANGEPLEKKHHNH